MLPQTHFKLGVLLVLILSVFTNFSLTALIIILSATVLIDVDHWFIYVKTTKKLGIRASYQWFMDLHHKRKAAKKKNPRVVLPKFLCIFHTIEFYLLILILSFFYSFFYYLLIGITFHYFLDTIADLIEKDQSKYFSIIYYFLKK